MNQVVLRIGPRVGVNPDSLRGCKQADRTSAVCRQIRARPGVFPQVGDLGSRLEADFV